MRSRIDNLTKNSSADEVRAAVDYVAGMPRSAHTALLDEIYEKCGMNISKVRMMLSQALDRRAVTKYPCLKLKNFLLSVGATGRIEGDTLIVPDPLVPGTEIVVCDAVLIGCKPLVQKVTGYAHRVDDYITALVGDANLESFTISVGEVKQAARQLSNCDYTRNLSASLLGAGNTAAFKVEFDKLDRMKNRSKEEDRERRQLFELITTLELNRRYALVDNNGQIVVFDRNSLTAYTRTEVEAKLANEEGRYQIWFHHPARIAYDGVTMAPNDCDTHGRSRDLSRQLNLWTGFVQDGAPGASWDRLKGHIKDIICNGDEVAFEYVMNWLAHLLQKPWEKPGVAIVVWGKKRTGKGTVADAIREICGDKISRMITQKEHVVGRFSISTQPLLFSQIEEAVFAKDPREEGPLKSKITDPTENIELKFKTPYEVQSFGRYWFNSNSETPVPVTFDEERYFILHVSPKRANDHAYFKLIRDQLYHEGGLAAMVQELMQRDITEFNVRLVPRTAAKGAMVLEMLDKGERAIADILHSGRIYVPGLPGAEAAIDESLNLDVHTWVNKDDLLAALNAAFARFGAKAASQRDIAKALKELGIVDGTRNAHAGRSEKAAYRFLPLNKARAAFAEKRDIPIELLTGDTDPFPSSKIGQIMSFQNEAVEGAEDLAGRNWQAPATKAAFIELVDAMRAAAAAATMCNLAMADESTTKRCYAECGGEGDPWQQGQAAGHEDAGQTVH